MTFDRNAKFPSCINPSSTTKIKRNGNLWSFWRKLKLRNHPNPPLTTFVLSSFFNPMQEMQIVTTKCHIIHHRSRDPLPPHPFPGYYQFLFYDCAISPHFQHLRNQPFFCQLTFFHPTSISYNKIELCMHKRTKYSRIIALNQPSHK